MTELEKQGSALIDLLRGMDHQADAYLVKHDGLTDLVIIPPLDAGAEQRFWKMTEIYMDGAMEAFLELEYPDLDRLDKIDCGETVEKVSPVRKAMTDPWWLARKLEVDQWHENEIQKRNESNRRKPRI
jgi:hypothetical protein